MNGDDNSAIYKSIFHFAMESNQCDRRLNSKFIIFRVHSYNMKKLTLAILALISVEAYSNVKLPKIFGANMVLQRGKPIPVWGWADPGEKISVQFNKQTKTVKADKSGKWMVKLDPESAGGPFTFLVKGKNSISLNNVMVGEVWVCSGQSNMEFSVSGAINASQEIAEAKYPLIRQIKVSHSIALTPKDDIASGEWKVCDPETAGDFTAVG
ncbi:MAG: hypothetical protein C5B52_05600, partial [Bacteroidetes bacterium]